MLKSIVQVNSFGDMAGSMLGNNILRINFESDTSLPADDLNTIDDVVGIADKAYQDNYERIKYWLNATDC